MWRTDIEIRFVQVGTNVLLTTVDADVDYLFESAMTIPIVENPRTAQIQTTTGSNGNFWSVGPIQIGIEIVPGPATGVGVSLQSTIDCEGEPATSSRRVRRYSAER